MDIRQKVNKILIFVIVLYQKTLSPLFGQRCKHYPSCSHYSIEALEKYGVLKGLILTTARLIRCNPWSYGGYDPIPENVSFKEIRSFKLTGNYQTKLYK